MSEKMPLDWVYLNDQILNAANILERPAVQIQILAITGSIGVSWLLSQWLWIQFSRRFPQVSRFDISESRLRGHYYGAALLRYLLTPTLSLLAVNLIRSWFLRQGWFTGFLTDGIYLLWFYGFYCFFLICLYARFPAQSVSQYRKSFFAPLLWIFITGFILNLFFDLSSSLQVPLLELFSEPVPLKAIFVLIFGLYFLFVGTSLLEKLIFHLLSSGMSQDPGAIQVLSLLLRYFLIGLGIVLILGYVGVNATALAAITGGLSVGIGFGLKEVISNFVSGIWLLFEGVLKPGDIISVDGQVSQVRRLGVRATTVQVLRDNSEQIIPNQTFFTQNVTTFTGSDRLVCRHLQVGASYKCDPQKVMDILLQVANQHPRVLKIPSPSASFIGFSDSSLDFNLSFRIDDPLIGGSITSELGCAIWKAFAENGIEIPYPQRDLHIRRDDEDFSDHSKL
jgi:potassium-dependent mechanosensitive channel